jgi:GNAT superfamily N-acetyltransferase
LRRARRCDRVAALAVDARSFDPFWRLDEAGLDEAIDATPASRFRVAEHAGGVIGYAVSGRAGSRGFLQRLAVEPDVRGQGIGTALVIDGLRWMKRRGATRAMVNTQERNESALQLYQRLGFQLQPGGLAVLHASLA